MKRNNFIFRVCCILLFICVGCNSMRDKDLLGSVMSLAVGNDYAAYVDGMGKLHILYDDANATEGVDLEKTYQSLGADPFCLVAVDGTVIVEDVEINHCVSSSEAWVDIASLAVAGDTVVGLKKDGTVVAVCKTGSDQGQCDVGEWTGIAAVGTNGNVTVGVKNNGEWVSTK